MTRNLVKPTTPGLVRLEVLRAERLAPHWMRVTFGRGDIDRFVPLGYDQWFRLFLPLGGDEALDRIPAKANRLFGYLKYLRIPEGERPVMRNYSVRAYRPSGPSGGAEIDVDFVLHGSGPTAGPASRWASQAHAGESVVIIDEGLRFNPERGVDRVLLVADETGAPAVASICASLPGTASGMALIEAPSSDDVLEIEAPPEVDVRWLVRAPDAKPGSAALAALSALAPGAVPAQSLHAFVVGEQSLPTTARRMLIADHGIPKEQISFVGYWREGAGSPAPRSQAREQHAPSDAAPRSAESEATA
ncbi:NADPH-dependent ferric siderophore reductase [Microbacterium paludicola]|uniref:NADPH-dependent ferric siderophore reductase n=1 Tax=Microbacterium paludicola TaxID=300019 RepID=A0ABU1I2R3_9MICO|nr:siderophore-interacting protein [Microbacterium paludicola]MDR6168176.1 NADPH-dependent ferric siderophore reductase [Microbacterium paludicola]